MSPNRFGLLAAFIAAFVMAACGGGETALQADSTPEVAPVRVAVARVATSSLAERIELTGHLEPLTEVRVASELGGMVEDVGFRKGDAVQEGQVLAHVGTDMHQAALDEAEAALRGAEASYNRVRQLFEREATTRQSLIAATADFETARARVAQNRLRLERSIIRAPLSGMAVTRELEPGEVLAPGAVITTIHRVDRLKVSVGIPEVDIGVLQQGSPAVVRVDAFPGRTFDGRVSFVSPSGSGSSRTFPAEIDVANSGGRLKPGMLAAVALVRRSFRDVVAIPRDVLQERDQGPVAMVLDGDDVARVRPVTLGAIEGDRVLVEQGLAAGDWIIVSGHRGLIDGQKVQITERRQ